jgi:hypothetical protein
MGSLGITLGLLGIAAGILIQIIHNSAIGDNPLMTSGAIVFGSGLIAGAIERRKKE